MKSFLLFKLKVYRLSTFPKLKCSNNFIIQRNALVNSQNSQNQTIVIPGIMHISQESYCKIIEYKFNEIYPNQESYIDCDKFHEFTQWIIFFLGFKSASSLSFPFLDKLLSNKELSENILKRSDLDKAIYIMGKLKYRNILFLDTAFESFLDNSHKINKLDVGGIMPIFAKCEFCLNDELFGDFFGRYITFRKATLNYNNLLLSFKALSSFKHTPNYSWYDLEQYFLLIIKRLFKPVSLLRIVESLDTISMTKNIKFKIWNILQNFIENNDNFFNNKGNLTELILAIISNHTKLSPKYEKILNDCTSKNFDKIEDITMTVRIFKILNISHEKCEIMFNSFLDSYYSIHNISNIYLFIEIMEKNNFYNDKFFVRSILENPYFSMLYLENYFRNYKNFLKVILYFSKKNTTFLKLISEISLNLNEHKTIEKVINIIYQLHEIKNDKEIFGYCGIMKHKINNYFNAIISYPDIYYSQLKTFLFLIPYLIKADLASNILEKSIKIYSEKIKYSKDDEEEKLINYIIDTHINGLVEMKIINIDIDKAFTFKNIKIIIDLSYQQINEDYKIECFSSKYMNIFK